MGRLSGKVAIITGAAQGQGETTAKLFAREGAKVAVVDMNADRGEAIAAEIGGDARFYRVDISQEAAWVELSGDLVQRFGRIDALINNAAICPAVSLLDMEAAQFQAVLNVNLVGTWLGIKTVGKQMVAQGSGSIINILSTGALWGINGLGAYVASKWGLRGLTKTAAMELGHRGVRVNAIAPGGIASPMAGVDDVPREILNQRFIKQPIARIGEPEEIAYTSLFLASDEASYLCGAEIAVDGGMTIGRYEDFLPGAPDALVAAAQG
jgi:3alpha(or 20beta)-hydroxysteroid dehydrogenase